MIMLSQMQPEAASTVLAKSTQLPMPTPPSTKSAAGSRAATAAAPSSAASKPQQPKRDRDDDIAPQAMPTATAAAASEPSNPAAGGLPPRPVSKASQAASASNTGKPHAKLPCTELGKGQVSWWLAARNHMRYHGPSCMLQRLSNGAAFLQQTEMASWQDNMRLCSTSSD